MFKCTNYFLAARRRSIEISRLFRITSRSSSSLSTTLFFPTSATSAISFVPISTFPSSRKLASTPVIPTTSIVPSRDSLYLQWNTIKENLAEIYGEIRCTLLVNLEFSICIKNTNTSDTNPPTTRIFINQAHQITRCQPSSRPTFSINVLYTVSSPRPRRSRLSPRSPRSPRSERPPRSSSLIFKSAVFLYFFSNLPNS